MQIKGNNNQVANIGGSVNISTPISGSLSQAIFGLQQPHIAPKEKTKVLYLSANPLNHTLRTDIDMSVVKNNLQKAKYREHIDIQYIPCATIEHLSAAMLEFSPDIVHFSGHCQPNGLLLHDNNNNPTLITGEQLLDILSLANQTVKAVILNACFSSQIGQILLSQIPIVIGMNNQIKDSSAIAFQQGFYQGLGACNDITAAYKAALVALKLHNRADANTVQWLQQ